MRCDELNEILPCIYLLQQELIASEKDKSRAFLVNMSDDDGMLLNFSTNESGAGDSKPSSTKVTGGRWKDRRKMKMMMAVSYTHLTLPTTERV